MTFCVRLGPATPPARIGGKARSLLRLAEAGLPVPTAIVVTTDLFEVLRAGGPKLPSSLAAPGALTTVEGAARALAAAPWPEGFASALAREIDTLVPEPGARYSVRSSASIEDEAGVLAAGLFLSRIDVDRGEVLEAVRAVLGIRAGPGRRRLPRAARPGDGQPRVRRVDPRVHRGRGGRRGGVRSGARRAADDRGAGGKGGRDRERAARAHRGRGARAGQDQRRGRAGMGGERRRAHVPAAAAVAIADAHAGAPRGRSRCRRSIRCRRPRIAT